METGYRDAPYPALDDIFKIIVKIITLAYLLSLIFWIRPIIQDKF